MYLAPLPDERIPKTDQDLAEAGVTRREYEATVAEGDSEQGYERQPFDPDQLTLF